jgi:branched-chain amino acid transport system ATP-binding protein
MSFLEVRDLEARYGDITVIHGIDFEVEEGEIVTILGANGAGKTTTLRALCGMVNTKGKVFFDGKDISNRRTEEIVRLGVAHVPEGRGTFAQLTVDENLRLGAYPRKDADVGADLDVVYTYFPRLRDRQRQIAGSLSGGEQQMLAIGRALVSRPRLMLLDEPSLGLAPLVVRELFGIIQSINQDRDTTVLLVEQNARLALQLASKAYLLETGRIALSGDAQELLDNEDVSRAYLGY